MPAAQKQAAGRRAKMLADAPVPVVDAPARLADAPVYLAIRTRSGVQKGIALRCV